ncbi:hypothetical protein [Pseudarthrobacter sp. LT1]|uniref:hypothetical protein n=1 Tax=Pseudarthrobacter sp. LT1 TaxID=3111450 RepID=UPI002D79DF58|nr:hypothetical protein [Pseudarthrobacter sp. LT1]WRT14672.1 hypothetical protein VIK36_04030 [Pseudarthrobacter sp. LT1]
MSKITSLTPEDFTLYADQMEKIKARIDAAAMFLQPPHVYPSVEAGLLQLRLALEALALSSLVTNRKAVATVSAAFMKKDHAGALKLVKRVNADYYPLPSEQTLDESGRAVAMREITEGFLTEGEYLPVWGRLSEWMHARNPFQIMPDPAEGAAFGEDVIGKLVALLNHHTVQLLERGELLACMMNESESGRVHVFGFEKASDN